MSHRVLAACVPLRMPSGPKAVLLSLADQANDDGVCWPSCAALCEWTCLSERAVRSAIRWLETAGVVQCEARRRNDGSRASNSYTVRPAAYQPADSAGGDAGGQQPADSAGSQSVTDITPEGPSNRQILQGVVQILHPSEPPKNLNTGIHPQPPLQGADQGGDAEAAAAAVARAALPSVPADDEPEDVPTAERALMTLRTMLALCRELGVKAIPPDDPVWAYCEQVGISRDLLALHWAEFKGRRIDTLKRQRGLYGWRQTFLNSVKANWYRLWFIPAGGGAAELTSVGRQALAAQEPTHA